MTSPLRLFRKYEKLLLALFGVMLMIAFVVVPSVMTFLGRHDVSRVQTGKETVVTWAHGAVSDNDLATMRYAHNLTLRFLDEVVRQTLQRDERANPRGLGVTRNRFGQIVDPGIPRGDTEGSLVETMVLARKAADLGIVVSDEAIVSFLQDLSDDAGLDFDDILRTTMDQRLSESQLFDRLRIELLAQKMRQLAHSGLFAITPGAAWEYQNRLSRRVKLETAPLRVADHNKDVREPSDAEIQAFYDKCKGVFPHPNSPDPGFKRRRKIAFQYLRVEFDKFLEAEKAKISDEQIAKYYEEHRADFKVTELPPKEEPQTTKPEPQTPKGESKPPQPQSQPAKDQSQPAKPESQPEQPKAQAPKDEPLPLKEKSPAEKKDAAQSGSEKSPAANSAAEAPAAKPAAEAPATKPAAEAPATKPVAEAPATTPAAEAPATKPAAEAPATKPAAEAPATKPAAEAPATKPAAEAPATKPAAEAPATKPAAEAPATKPAAEAPAPKTDPLGPTPQADQKPASGTGQKESGGDKMGRSALEATYVSFTATEEPASGKLADELASPTNLKTDAAAVGSDQEKAATSKPATGQGDAAPSPPKAPPSEPASVAGQPEPKKPAAGPVPGDKAAVKEPATAAAASEKAPQYKPLEEVKDEIRRSLAQQPAQQKMDAALADVKRAVERYFQSYVKWETWEKLRQDGQDVTRAEKPAPLDVAQLAKEVSSQCGVQGALAARETPLADSLEFAQRHAAGEESFELGGAYHFSFEGGQFQQFSFSDIAFDDGTPLYRSNRIDSERDVRYIYWKAAEQQEESPQLKEIRGEVIDAWKQREALTLTLADANRLAEQARRGGGTLKESLSGVAGLSVVESDEFSWMTMGALPYSQGALRLSDVKGVENPGEEFMEAVFSLELGGVGVAVNRPRTYVYVVRVLAYSPPEGQRREQFLESGLTMPVAQLARQDQQEIYRRWYQQVETEMQVAWNREPEKTRRTE